MCGQHGVMLLEVLVAILIFSVGVLSVIKLQSEAVKQSTGAEYRAMASLLAGDLVSRMWGSDRRLQALKDSYESKDGEGYKQWRQAIVDSGLPNAFDEENLPRVAVAEMPNGTEVTVILGWRVPGEKESHRYSTVVLFR